MNRPISQISVVLVLFGYIAFSASRTQPTETPSSVDVLAQESNDEVPHRQVIKSTPFSDTVVSRDTDFYETIIRNNLFAPLGTVLTREGVPGAHLTLVGTFVSEDPSASTVLVKNTTTGHHHWLSVGEGVGDFHVLRIEAKQVVFYHQGTEVTLHLPDAVFLDTKRR